MATNKPKPKIALARQFRKALTGPEYLLWERLKLRTYDGLTFRRQHPAGPYILDFYCAKAKLAVEIDGHEHGEDARRILDEARNLWLSKRGILTYRLPAAEVYRDPDAAADGVRLLALARPHRK
jgi:very-short-patch-repair endonuclease